MRTRSGRTVAKTAMATTGAALITTLSTTTGCLAPQSDSCAQWLACASTPSNIDGISDLPASPTEVLQAKFGADGWCWTNPMQASLCSKECADNLDKVVEARSTTEIPPVCRNDGSNSGNPSGTGQSNSVFAGTQFASLSVGVLTADIPGGVFQNETVQLTEEVEPAPAAYRALTPVFTWVPAFRSLSQVITLTFRVPGGLTESPVVYVDEGTGSFRSTIANIAGANEVGVTAAVQADLFQTSRLFLSYP